ncbi:MAG: DUF4388 domain-containing protein [Sumerlaeia bacterium]
MQGNLHEVPLPEVLQFISMGKPSGMLHLRRDNNEITLYVKGGRIINSSSIERKRRLGDLLVQRGLLKRSELSQLLQLQKTVESDKRLGHILVERDVIPEETIREVLRMQLEEEIWALFAWKEGEFRFETVDEARLGDAIVHIDIEPLILEGTRRNDEWEAILDVIPNDSLVLTVASLDEEFDRDSLNLKPQEWKVLSEINGRFTIKAIVNRSGMGRFEVHRILSQFIKSGLVVIRADTPLQNKSSATTAKSADRADAGKKGGILSLIGGTKTKDKGAKETLSFISPIGVMGYFVNVLAQRVTALKEYAPSEGDDSLYEAIWSDIGQTYTKADLLSVSANSVNTRDIETFFSGFEFKEAVDDCYEDTIEALTTLLQTAFRVFATRVGERPASRIVRELLDELGDQTIVKYRGPFPLVERVQNVLRLAA